MMVREDCEKGFFVVFDYTEDALRLKVAAKVQRKK